MPIRRLRCLCECERESRNRVVAAKWHTTIEFNMKMSNKRSGKSGEWGLLYIRKQRSLPIACLYQYADAQPAEVGGTQQ